MTGAYGLVPRWNTAVSKLTHAPCPLCGEMVTTEDEPRRQHIAGCELLAARQLNDVEQKRLNDLETVIQRGIKVYMEVGTALLEIRDSRLYRQSHGSFEDYCQQRWQMTRRSADRLIEASKVAENLRPIGLVPANESQAREFTGLEADEQRALARLSTALFGDKQTASSIRFAKEFALELMTTGAITVDGESVSIHPALDYTLTEEQHERLLRKKQNIATNSKRKTELLDKFEFDALSDADAGALRLRLEQLRNRHIEIIIREVKADS